MAALAQLQTELVEASFRREMGQVSRHSFVFFLGTLFTAVGGYAFKIFLARKLGADALGIFTLGLTIVGLVGVFTSLGLAQSAARFVAAYRATHNSGLLRGFLMRSVVVLLVANAAAGLALLLVRNLIAARIYHTPALTSQLPWFAIIMVFAALNGFLAQVLAGFKDIARRTVITSFVGSPVMMLISVAFVAAGLGLRGYILAQILSALLVFILLTISCLKLLPMEARSLDGPFPSIERQVTRFSAAVLGMNLLEFLISQSDKLITGLYLNVRSLGIYAVAAGMVTFVPVILQSVNQIFSPTISELHARADYNLLARMHRTLTKWVFGLTLPLAAVMIIFSPTLMLIFGKQFEVGWPVLVIGTVGQLVNCATGSVGYLLLMSGNQHSLIRIQALSSAAVITLLFLLVPAFGIVGAAAASAASVLISNALCAWTVRQKLGFSAYNRGYLALALPATASILTLFWTRYALANWPGLLAVAVALVLGYAVFVGVALAVGLDSDDQLVKRAMFNRVRNMFLRAEANA